MTPPRLHLIAPGSLGEPTGGCVYDARLAGGLRDLGWQVVAHELDGRFPDADAEARSSLRRALAGLPDRARVIVDGLAMGGVPDVVRTQACRLRLLSLVHHPLADETGLERRQQERFTRLERSALEACAGVVVTSQHTAARLGDVGVPQERIRVVVPGTDPVSPAIGPGPGAPPLLLCVGSVTPRKGQDLLVRALASLRELSWRCVVAGSLTRAPDHADAVRRLALDAGLDGRVTFLGACATERLDELYHTSSLFVLASHYEGYGMALAEALGRGLPIVSTTGGAIPLTVPADAARLVPPGDVGALARALRDLLLDDPPGATGGRSVGAARRAALAAAARRHGRALPDWRQATAAFAEAILELTPRA